MNKTRRPWYRCSIVCALVLLGSGPASLAHAVDMTITARYAGGTDREFQNTTPPSGYCTIAPEFCGSEETVGLPITYTRAAEKGAADVRSRYYVRMPASRKVTVTNHRGETHDLTLMFTVFTQEVVERSGLHPPVMTPNVHGGCSFLTGEWDDAESPGGGPPRGARYAWMIKNPANPQGCYSDADSGDAGELTVSDVSDFAVGYRLQLPNPNRMRQGIYRGSTTYLVGPGGDIDLGNGVSNLNSNSLTLNFELVVEHALDVRFPPGTDRAVLEPPGGWQAWLGGRGVPPRLHRDLPLYLWSTGPFSVFKRCEFEVGDKCAVRNAANHQVPVQVALSMPPGVSLSNSQVRRVPIPSGMGAPLRLDQSTPIADQRGELHFEIDQSGVDQMTVHAGSTYEGKVTIVFDAEL